MVDALKYAVFFGNIETMFLEFMIHSRQSGIDSSQENSIYMIEDFAR
jgi:hypothetical protein